jgi:hypothetical protein
VSRSFRSAIVDGPRTLQDGPDLSQIEGAIATGEWEISGRSD